MLLFNFILSCIMKFSYIVAKDSLLFNLCNITRPTWSGGLRPHPGPLLPRVPAAT